MTKLIEKVLEDGDKVPFVAYTTRYGLAEFVFCLKYIRSKLKHIYIYPAQQENVINCFQVDVNYAESVNITSFTHKGMDDPKIWLQFWCKEHDCPAMRVYVPKQATHFHVSKLSSILITFDKEG
jgi:hypothetical protein